MAQQQRSRPRKSPQQARSQDTVAAIVEAAARILEKEGYDRFSTNAVAEKAGVSIGSLYQYFPRKDALIGALIAREGSKLLEAAATAGGAPSGVKAMRDVIAAAVAHQFRRPALARLLDFEEARLPVDADREDIETGFIAVLRDVLRKTDMPRRPNRDATVRDILAIIKGMVNAAGAYGETDARALNKRVCRAVFGYLEIAGT